MVSFPKRLHKLTDTWMHEGRHYFAYDEVYILPYGKLVKLWNETPVQMRKNIVDDFVGGLNITVYDAVYHSEGIYGRFTTFGDKKVQMQDLAYMWGKLPSKARKTAIMNHTDYFVNTFDVRNGNIKIEQ